jgi:hypothetical protein
LQSFEVGVSVGLAQYDEPHSFDSGRCVTEPQLEVIVNYRAGMQRIEFAASLVEAKALAAVLQEGIHQLGMVHEAASTPDARASWALGWTPETLR